MRARVLAVLVGFSFLAVTGFGWPLLDASSRVRTQQLQLDRVAALDRFSALATQAIASGDPVTLRAEVERFTALYGERILVVGPDAQTLVATRGLAPESRTVAPVLAAAERNLPRVSVRALRPWSRAHQLLARPVGAPNQVLGAVVLEADVSAAVSRVRRQWAVVLSGALVAELALFVLAVGLTRWVVGPVRLLDEAAVALAATGDVRLRPGGGPPELRRLTASFSLMAETVTSMARLQRRLIADCSHQLRNPLAAVRLRVDALVADPGGDQGRELSLVVDDLDRLEHLITDLLDLAEAESRVSSRTVPPDEGPAPPHAVIPVQVEPLIREELQRARIRPGAVTMFMTCLVEADTWVRCDAEDLHRMVAELLENAVKYAGADANIWVSCEHRDDRVLLAVTDDGPGLSDEQRRLAPQRFWRLARDAPLPGTGLGLAIVSTLAEANGAGVALKSAQPRGLVVLLDLPAGTT